MPPPLTVLEFALRVVAITVQVPSFRIPPPSSPTTRPFTIRSECMANVAVAGMLKTRKLLLPEMVTPPAMFEASMKRERFAEISSSSFKST